MANDVRAIASHWAPNSGATADVNAMRESGLHTPVALDDRTYGGRSFAKMVTRSPVCCAVIAAVKPSAPHPITATSRLPVAASRAFFTANQQPPTTATTRFRRVQSCAPQPCCPRARRPSLAPRRETASGKPWFGRSGRHAPVSNDRPHRIIKRQRLDPARRRSTPFSHPARPAKPNPANAPDCCKKDRRFIAESLAQDGQ